MALRNVGGDILIEKIGKGLLKPPGSVRKIIVILLSKGFPDLKLHAITLCPLPLKEPPPGKIKNPRGLFDMGSLGLSLFSVPVFFLSCAHNYT